MEIVEFIPCGEIEGRFELKACIKDEVDIERLYSHIKNSLRYDKIGYLDTTKIMWLFSGDTRLFITKNGSILSCWIKK